MGKKLKEPVEIISKEEKQQAFLLKLSDALRPLGKPEDIEEAATKIALDFMDADRCHFCTIEEENIIILRDAFRKNFPSVVGVYPISSFPLYKAVLNAGRPFIVDEVPTANILDEDLKKMCLQFQYGAFINVPVVKNGKPVGLLSLVQSKSRKWTDIELQLTIETAERIWAAVEKAKAEEALRISEEKYHMLFDSIDEGFSILKVLFDDKRKAVDYIFLEMNPAHEAMTGMSQTAVGMRISELMPEMEESVIERLGKVVLTGESIRYEQYVSAWNRWFDVHSSRVGGDGSPLVANVFNNITDRKQAEEKLKESESRFRTMADASPVLIWTIDANGLSAYYNKTFLDFIGVSKNEDISDWGKIVHPDDLQFTLDTINTAIAERRSYSLECRLLRAGGQWRWVLAQGNPRMGVENEFLGFVGSSVDITERKEAEAKIKESEKKFEAAITAVEGIIWTNNGIGEMIGEQPGWAKLTGQRFEEYQGYGWSSAVHPDDAQPTLDAWSEAVKNKRTFEFEHRLKTKQDGWRLFSVKAVPTIGEKGAIQQWVGVHRDVTEQKEAVQKIKESEQRFRALADQSPMIVYIVEPDASATMSYFNETWLNYTGQNFEEAIGRAWDGIVHPDDLQGVFDIYVPAFQAGQSYTLPAVRLKRYDDEYRWHMFKGNARYLPNGEFNGYIGVGFDIHEQKLAEEKVIESEKQFSILANNIQNLAWIANSEGWIYWYNQRWYDYTGTTLEQMQGWGWQSVHHPDMVEGVTRDFANAVATGVPYDDTFLLRSKEGEYRWFLTRALPIKNERGEIIQWLGTNTDVSAQRETEEALKTAKEQLELTFRNVPSAIYHFDKNGKILYLNEIAAKQLGYTTIEEVLAEKDVFNFRKNLDKTFEVLNEKAEPLANGGTSAALTLATGKASEVVSQFIHRQTGVAFWLLSKSSPLFDENGELSIVLTTSTDITFQKTYEQTLQYRKALLEAHNEASRDGILLVDAKGKIISYNQRFIELWNMPQEIVDAKNDEAALSFAMTQLVNPQQFIEKVKYLYDHPKETSIDELEFIDGKILHRSGYPVMGDNDKYYAWSWTFRDITEQRLFEKTLQESEERFRLLADEMPQFVWVGDKEGNLNYFNKAVYEYSGLTEQDMLEGNWIQIVHPHDREKNISLWLESISTGNLFHFEHRFRNKAGEYRWQLSRAIPQRDVHGVIQQWIGTSTDIHDRKNVEEQLERVVAERTKELQRSNEDLQQFAHVASHDLKEPVRKIKTFTGRLEQHLDGKLDETGNHYIERIHAATNRMYNMIDGVLAYSFTTNPNTQKPQEVDLTEVVRNIEADLEVVLQKTGAKLHYNNLPTVEGAQVLLYQLFYNLINNSNKFARPGVPPVITISAISFVEDNQNFVRIVLQDNGIGFMADHAKLIFETFARLNSKDKYEGTGLGLSLCKKIVQRHGGSIIASGIPDEGATFTITLPVQQKHKSI